MTRVSSSSRRSTLPARARPLHTRRISQSARTSPEASIRSLQVESETETDAGVLASGRGGEGGEKDEEGMVAGFKFAAPGKMSRKGTKSGKIGGKKKDKSEGKDKSSDIRSGPSSPTARSQSMIQIQSSGSTLSPSTTTAASASLLGALISDLSALRSSASNLNASSSVLPDSQNRFSQSTRQLQFHDATSSSRSSSARNSLKGRKKSKRRGSVTTAGSPTGEREKGTTGGKKEKEKGKQKGSGGGEVKRDLTMDLMHHSMLNLYGMTMEKKGSKKG